MKFTPSTTSRQESQDQEKEMGEEDENKIIGSDIIIMI
jgi:hypothetical protein